MAEPEQPRSSPDPIAEALRGAGARPPLPPMDLEALSAPALAVWQQQVARRRSRRRVLGLAAALAVFVSAFLLVRGPARQPVIATVTAYAGEGPMELGIGSGVPSGGLLTTSRQPAEWLALELREGHHLRLDAGSMLRLTSPTRVDLLRGGVYVEAAPAELRIYAGDLVSEHLGTRYEVRLDGGVAAVRVREGRVQVKTGEQRVEIGRGERVVLVGEGVFEVEESPTFGDSWAWIQQAAPPFHSDGAELESFLDWVKAETGWEVDIDPSLLLDPSGQPVRVRGSIERLSVEDALSLVLESAGLSHGVEGDRLRVVEAP